MNEPALGLGCQSPEGVAPSHSRSEMSPIEIARWRQGEEKGLASYEAAQPARLRSQSTHSKDILTVTQKTLNNVPA